MGTSLIFVGRAIAASAGVAAGAGFAAFGVLGFLPRGVLGAGAGGAGSTVEGLRETVERLDEGVEGTKAYPTLNPCVSGSNLPTTSELIEGVLKFVDSEATVELA